LNRQTTRREEEKADTDTQTRGERRGKGEFVVLSFLLLGLGKRRKRRREKLRAHRGQFPLSFSTNGLSFFLHRKRKVRRGNNISNIRGREEAGKGLGRKRKNNACPL